MKKSILKTLISKKEIYSLTFFNFFYNIVRPAKNPGLQMRLTADCWVYDCKVTLHNTLKSWVRLFCNPVIEESKIYCLCFFATCVA